MKLFHVSEEPDIRVFYPPFTDTQRLKSKCRVSMGNRWSKTTELSDTKRMSESNILYLRANQ